MSTRPARGAGIEPLAQFVAGLQPGERNDGLFWAACRAAQDHLDPAPLTDAAVSAGLGEHEAQHAIASAAATIAKARRQHGRVNP